MTASPTPMFEWHVRYLRTRAVRREELRGLARDESEAIQYVQDFLLEAPPGTGPAGRISRVRSGLDGYERLGLVAYATRDDASGLIIWTPVRRRAGDPASVHRPANGRAHVCFTPP